MKAPLGQNFLVDDSARHAIVDALGDAHDRLVIEVGPGGGALTSLLARRAGRLVAIEFDRVLAQARASEFSDNARFQIIADDVRKVDLTALVREQSPVPGARAVLIGNLPYYITSDILLHLVEHAAALEQAVVMMQREVADRVTAQPGTRDYGLLSVSVQMAAQAEALFVLPPEAFRPSPQVFSSVVRLTMRPRYEELGVERAAFERFLRQCFAHKRKTLANNLRAAGYSAEAASDGFEAAGIATGARAESASVEHLSALHVALRNAQR